MAGSVSITSVYKTNFHKYDDCVKIIARREVHRVFTWLYQGGSTYVGDYLKEKEMLNNMQKSEIRQLEVRILPEDMDILFLYNLLQYTCGLTDATKKIWDKPQLSEVESLEHSLFLLKKKRNELCHEDQKLQGMSNSTMIRNVEEVSKLCCRILNEAGLQSGKLQEAADAISKMEVELQRLIGMTPELFASRAKQERRNCITFNHERYASPILIHNGSILPLSSILATRSSDEQESSVIIVRGDAGTGKSTLCECLEWLWLNEKEDILELLDYELLLVIDCQKVRTSDATCLLKQDLIPDTMTACNPYEAPDLLAELSILWIIDSLEFATPAATMLIDDLMQKENSKHTYLILSRPEHSYAITANMNPTEYVEISIDGIELADIFQKLQSLSQSAEYSNVNLKSFISSFAKLDYRIQVELRNPLKLDLAMRFWKRPLNDLQNISNLCELYEAIKVDQIESLAKKFQRGSVAHDDAIRRVTSWFASLCQTAFDITLSKKVIAIDSKKLTFLKEKCDQLQFPSADNCLSSFLTHRGPGKYNFFHTSQQYYYAALHAASAFQNCEDLSDVAKLFKIPNITHEEAIAHLYEVLLHMVALLQESISRLKAEHLIHFLNFAIHGEASSFKWFDVIRNGHLKKEFLIPISKVIPEVWYVSDQNVNAAKHLLQFSEPSYIAIHLIENPKDVIGLKDMLNKISFSELPVEVSLLLNYHFRNANCNDSSDEFLQIICHEESNCCITAFSGHLSMEGYKILQHDNIRDHCQFLLLKVKLQKCLSSLCYHTKKFTTIENIQLIFAFLDYHFVRVGTGLPVDCTVSLNLLHMNDGQVDKAIKLISALSKTYHQFMFSKLSKKGALNFVHQLHKNQVQVREFSRIIINEDKKHIIVNYGSIPLPYSTDHFEAIWVLSEKFPQVEVRFQI